MGSENGGNHEERKLGVARRKGGMLGGGALKELILWSRGTCFDKRGIRR